ncbi:uncharacterized protein V6R79_021471 [Siganus canaliculatus]
MRRRRRRRKTLIPAVLGPGLCLRMNGSELITFSFSFSLGSFQPLLLLGVLLVLYVSGLGLSFLLVLVVCSQSRLHRPMYVLLVNLVLAGVMGSSSVCPGIVRQLLQRRLEVTLSACLSQTFFTNVYGGCMFCLLALMAVDRCLCICRPLLYRSTVTPARLAAALLGLYAALSGSAAGQVYLTSRLRLCSRLLNRVLCDSVAVAELACSRSPLVGLYGLGCGVAVVALPCVLVLLSYLQIFVVVLRLSRAPQQRALQTCAPHLLTFISFSAASFFGFVSSRVGRDLPKALNMLTSINFFVLPPLLHPLIYGLKMREIRQSVRQMMKRRRKAAL